MRMIVAVVEDDDGAAAELERCLVTYGEKTGVTCSVVRFASAVAFLAEYKPLYDIIFMDIKMPGLSGMEAAQKLREFDKVSALIFVTSMVQYAVKGYEVEALDFIVKPVRYLSFAMKMDRAVQSVQAKRGQELVVQVNGAVRVLSSSAISYIEVMNHNLTYHTDEGAVCVRGKLSEAEKQLPDECFFRCSTSYIINLRYITHVKGEIVWLGEVQIPVSRAKKKELLTALAKYLGRGL